MGTVLILQLGCSLVKQHLKAREPVLGEVEMFILMDAIMNAYRVRPWLQLWGGLGASTVFKGEQSLRQPWALGTHTSPHNLPAHRNGSEDLEITAREISHHMPLITCPLFTVFKPRTSNAAE